MKDTKEGTGRQWEGGSEREAVEMERGEKHCWGA